MGYRPEDLQLDEGYWRALLHEAEQLPIAPTRQHRPSHLDREAEAPSAESHGTHPSSGVNATLVTQQRTAPEPSGLASPDPTHPIWLDLQNSLTSDVILQVEVTGCNRGGLIVLYNGLRGFIPSSHLHNVAPDMDEPTRRTALANHIGQMLNVRVIELEPEQGRAVFSERASAENDPTLEDIPDVLKEVRPGETRKGMVTNLTAFGAFVDLGGYEGLVHVSELSWSRVNHPRDMLHIGDEVQVHVMSVAPEEGRIALSIKRARPNPWENIEQRYRVGQTIQGIVTNVVQFGAFVKVEDELEGLVHVSELAEGSFMHPRNIVREGEHVTARVIAVDSAHRRLALSLRNVEHAANVANGLGD
jgi:small subunit ribosomal protein S1